MPASRWSPGGAAGPTIFAGALTPSNLPGAQASLLIISSRNDTPVIRPSPSLLVAGCLLQPHRRHPLWLAHPRIAYRYSGRPRPPRWPPTRRARRTPPRLGAESASLPASPPRSFRSGHPRGPVIAASEPPPLLYRAHRRDRFKRSSGPPGPPPAPTTWSDLPPACCRGPDLASGGLSAMPSPSGRTAVVPCRLHGGAMDHALMRHRLFLSCPACRSFSLRRYLFRDGAEEAPCFPEVGVPS